LNTVVASNKSNDEHAAAIDKLDDAARNRVQLQHSLDLFNYLITGFVSVLGMVVVLLAVLQLGSDSKSRSSNPTNILTVLGLVAFLQARLTSLGSTNIAVATECGRNSAHNIPQQEKEEEVVSAQQKLLSSEHALLLQPSKTFAELCASFSDSSSDSTTSTCKMQVSFSQVSFSFPGYPLLLNAFSWTMSPGVNVLRAPSGSGKTTLAKLLMRMLTATSGSISINGTNIYDLDPAVLRRCICFTNQDMGVLNRPLRELLAYGTQATEDQVVSTWMQFSDMFTGLELADFAGVDGRNLSTGQKQIVRLGNLQLSSAPVVIADEPCSGLDPGHRQRAIEVLRRIGASGKTLLVITHEEDVAALADNLKEVTSFSE
jgi:ABC-type multidrug transport system fused ATPase/permease subunit